MSSAKAKFYANMVKLHKITLDEVPQEYLLEVKEILGIVG